jgi:Spy/CpxP family protein refolding chaperone
MNPRLKLSRNVLLALVASAAVAVAYETFAVEQTDAPRAWQGHGHHHGEGYGHDGEGAFGPGMISGFGAALRQLDLTDDQKKSVHDIFEAAHPQMQKMRDDMRNMVQTFQNILPDDPNYVSVVAQVSSESQQLAASMVSEASNLKSKVYAVLTPEQKATLPDVMKKMSAEHSKRREPQPPGATN